MTDAAPRHLVLVGMMGVGKSTVGAACATELDCVAIDTDELVVTEAGRSIADIFATDGEAAFRAFEQRAVRDACASPVPAVIVCGGGAVLDAENRRTLRTHGVVVWLRASAATIAARTHDDDSRPLLAGRDPETALARLVEQRESAYEAAAHTVVDTDGRAIDAVVADVLAAYAAR